MNINHISVSRSGVWEECQQKYKFQYHLKIPSPTENPEYFIYGSVIHKVSEIYVHNKGKMKLGDIADAVLKGQIILERNGENKPIKLSDEYKRKIPNHLRSIQSLTEKIGFDGYLEWQFKYDLDPLNDRCVFGFIDRLIKREDQFWIIDYKTTKKGNYRKNALNIGEDLQLRTYAKVVQNKFGAKPENIRGALYYLEGGDLISTKFTQKSIDSAENFLLQSFKNIESADPDKVWGKVGPHCTRCAYAKMCPFYRSSSSVDASKLPLQLL